VQPDFEAIIGPQANGEKEQLSREEGIGRETVAGTLSENDVVLTDAQVESDIIAPLGELKSLALRRSPVQDNEITVAIGRKPFTAEQMEVLLRSPHVNRVTPKTVSYTKAFKEDFIKRYCEGEAPTEIFASCGLDPDIIGRKRIYGFCQTLRVIVSEGKEIPEGKPPRGKDLLPIPKRRAHQTAAQVFASLSAEDVHKLYQRVIYLTQEMEFLKKIMLLDREGE
jgi:hypothetical protein